MTKFQVVILNGFRVTSDTHINKVKVLTRALSAQSLAAIELTDIVGGATYLHQRRVYGASACNVRSNVSLRLLEKFSMGDPGTF